MRKRTQLKLAAAVKCRRRGEGGLQEFGMKWFVTAANRLNHIDIYKWDGKDITLAKRVPTGKTPSHLWIDSKSTTIYSTMQDSDELIAIDLATQAVKWRTKTGSIPADVYGTADDKFMLAGLHKFDLKLGPELVR